MTGVEYYLYRLRMWLCMRLLPDGWAIYDSAAIEARIGAAKQLAWMDYMDRVAQEELGARPRGEVIVELEDSSSNAEEPA